MLNVMRENLRHLKWLLLLVAVAMLLYLGSYFTGSPSGRSGAEASWVAKVDGTSIPIQSFFREAQVQEEYFRDLFGAQYDQIKSQISIGERAVTSLVNRQIMVQEARKLGFQATGEDLARWIQESPQFRGRDGEFIGKEQYLDVVTRRWSGVADFEQYVAEQLAIDKWIGLVTEPSEVSPSDLEQRYRVDNDKTSIDYVFVASESTTTTPVTSTDISKWYDSHRDDYRRGDGRRIRYVVLDRRSQEAKIQVSEEEVRGFYESNKADFQREEQRRARHILFRSAPDASPAARQSLRALAESVLVRLKGGEDFAALARSMSMDTVSAEKGGDLGFFGRGTMTAPFEKAAFETPEGRFAPVVESEFGFHLIQVTGARPAGTQSLEEVAPLIRQQLLVRRAQARVKSEAERIRKEIVSATDLDSVGAREGLKVEERVVAQNDRASDLGPSPEFMSAVFSLPQGEVSNPTGVASGMAIFTVTQLVPSTVPPLLEVQERVQADVLQEKGREAALATARRALARGGDLGSIAKSLKLAVKSLADMVPDQALPGIGRSPELKEALFGPAAAVASRGVVTIPTGAVIYAITVRQSFDPVRFEAAKPQLLAEMLEKKRSELLDSVLEGLRQKRTIEINQPLVASIKG